MESNKEVLSLVDSGLSLIPIVEGEKRPHPVCLDENNKHNLLYVAPTRETVESWVNAGVASWGVACGAVSGNLMTIDFDEKHYSGLYDLWYTKLSDDQRTLVDNCAISGTRNGGKHVRYHTQTPHPTVKLARRVELNKKTQKEEIVTTAETRGEGSYALIPPSAGYTMIQGSLLDMPVISDEIHGELIDILRTFNEVEDEPATKYEFKEGDNITSDRPGDRFNQKATWNQILEPHGWVEEEKNRWRRPGKDKGEGISATTDYDDRPMFYVFSTSASPFEANKGYSKFHTYALLNHGGDLKTAARVVAKIYSKEQIIDGEDVEDSATSEKETQASRLLKLIQSRKDIVIFRDTHSDPFVALEVNGIRQIWSCRSKQFKNWLSYLYWTTYDKNISSEAKKGVIGTLEGIANFEKEIIPLNTRNAFYKDEIWYDLTNEKWQAIKVNASNWELVEKPPILFRRFVYNRDQVMPIPGGDLKLILKYFNISDPGQQLLTLIHIVCLFIPEFAHPILLIHGQQGSSKTTFSKILRRVIDPSVMETASMPETHRELVQVIAHNSFLFFDNVSWISESVSDILAKAVTGASFPKRELYSDDDDIVYTFRRGLGINGINMVAMRPDLLERSIILKLDHIKPENRKLEKVLMSEFENDLPSILGGIFDILVKAIALKPSIEQPELPRMADFALWGCAVAEAMGLTQKEFLDAYNTNIALQTEIVINENLVASTLIAFMISKGYMEWTGTATGLLTALSDYARDHHMDTYDRQWPKSHSALSRKLNELKVNLLEAGWSISTGEGKTRKITIHWVRECELEAKPADEFEDF